MARPLLSKKEKQEIKKEVVKAVAVIMVSTVLPIVIREVSKRAISKNKPTQVSRLLYSLLTLGVLKIRKKVRGRND